MRPRIAYCHLGFGKLYRRTGQHAQAQEHLATATMMYREMAGEGGARENRRHGARGRIMFFLLSLSI